MGSEQVLEYSQMSKFDVQGVNRARQDTDDHETLYYAAALHNAVTLFAHAASKVWAQGGNLRDVHAVSKAVRSTKIVGIGGSIVALDELGEPITSFEVVNYQLGTDNRSHSVTVGLFNSSQQQYLPERTIIWPGSALG